MLTVIKRLDVDKWAVGIGGRVYPAYSRIMLEDRLHSESAGELVEPDVCCSPCLNSPRIPSALPSADTAYRAVPHQR